MHNINQQPAVTLPPVQTLSAQVSILGQTVDYYHALIKSLDAHHISKGEAAVVYIIDTAARWDHDDLDNEGNFFAADFVGEDVPDGNGHGHYCAGVIGAIDNSRGVIGIAPRSIIVPIRGLSAQGQGFSQALARSVEHARITHLRHFPDRVGIINMSFGGGAPIKKLEEQLRLAVDAGMIPVAAAGNAGQIAGKNTVGWPGRYDSLCITVAALDQSTLPANFSSAGPEVDVAAYGVQILTTNNKRGYSRVNGTSFAAPIVAGIIALFATRHLEAFKGAGPRAKALAEKFIKEHAADLLEEGEDDITGAGLPIITPYLQFMPSQPSQDIPEDPEHVHTERTLRFLYEGEGWHLPYHASTLSDMQCCVEDNAAFRKMSEGGRQIIEIESLEVTVQSTRPAEAHGADLVEQLQAFFTNRSLMLRPGDDLERAAYFTALFLEIYLKNKGYRAAVARIVAADPETGTIIIFTKPS